MNIGNQLKGWLGLALAFCTLGTLPIHAQVRLPNVFSDHMVLQQQQENKVWGRASANELITVTIADQRHSTTADANGDWHVKLQPLTAGGPHELTVSASNTIKIADVLVGEVWICSGQSNMQWNVQQSSDPDLEKLTAKFPNIRMINFPQVGSQEPIWEHPKSKWQVCSPESVLSFSAVGYSFARQLHLALDVPIGMINNAWGGSACEAWISRNTLQSAGGYDELLAHWDALAREADELSANENSQTDEVKKKRSGLQGRLLGNHRPGNIYNGVLKSHLGYGIRGAIWYQGESNASRAYQYRDLFPLMISSWRQEWGQGDFPFYWVQLADFKPESADPMESDWAELREAQTMTQDRLPKTGQAVIIDIGEGKDIHPQNKSDVGKRLARLALANDYSVDIAAQSPRFQSMEKQGNKIVLTFSHTSGGWRPFDVTEPVGFAIAGEDKKFVWATANVLSDHRIEVFHSQIPNPQAVRYGWADNPKCNMYSRAGLPLTPFRTDDWPGVTINNKK